MKKLWITCLLATGLGAGTALAQNQPELDPTQPDTTLPDTVIEPAAPEIEEPAGTEAESPTDSSTPADAQDDPQRTVVEPSGAERKVGAITIQGYVRTAEEREAFEKAVKQLPGVKEVNNRLTLVGDLREPAGAERTEEEVLERDEPPAPESTEPELEPAPEAEILPAPDTP